MLWYWGKDKQINGMEWRVQKRSVQIQHLVFNKLPTEFKSRWVIFLTNGTGTIDTLPPKKEYQHEPHNLSVY